MRASAAQDDLWRLAKTYRRSCLKSKTQPQLKEFANQVGMTRFKVTREFRRRYGISFREYLTEPRLPYAKRLLRMTNLPIDEIAKRAGFGTRRNLDREFVGAFGVTASEYRKSGGKQPW